MSKKLTYWGNDRGIKRKVLLFSLMLLIMVGGILFAAPSLTLTSTAQAQQTPAITTPSPLTLEELREQNRLSNVTDAITRNLQQGEMKINGIVYTPRWANPVWVEPNSLSVLFVYCLPGEFADSGQQIPGSRDLNVLESYSIALSPVLTGWLMVVENEHQTERNPAAVGAICTSDANDPESRIVSPQEQTVIKNVVQQFITIRNIQKTNITQIINIINNVTSNQTGGGGGGNNQTSPLTVSGYWDTEDGGNAPATISFESDVDGGRTPYNVTWDFGDGQKATNSAGCCRHHTYENPGHYTATVTVTDDSGQTVSDSTEVIVQPAAPTTGEPTTTNETAAAEVTPPPATGEGETTAPEQPPTTGGGVVAEEPPPAGTTTTEGEEATTTTTPPASLDTLGQ
ncbi:MAG: PKD domain-containing protein [Nitrososphaera sp.]